MKRCPQCEFLYEDDQSLCDMDGALLVLDSRALPNLHALATVRAVPAAQTRRNRAMPAFATLVLASLLGMVYYVSTQRHTYTPAPAPARSTSLNSAPATNPAPAAQPAQPAESPEESPKEEETKPAPAAKQPAATPAKKPPAKTAAAPQPTNTRTEAKKDDSKVGSILKKTGHILKKPFKF
jgi:cytoskeletal protein RodZ